LMYKTCLMFVTAAMMIGANSLQAGPQLTVSPSSSNFVEGQSGHIDIMISSNTDVDLDGYSIQVSFTGGAAFGPASNVFLNESNYVFFNRSGIFANGQSAIVISSPTIAIANDFSYDFASSPTLGDPKPFRLPNNSSPSLLARFLFTAVSPGTVNVSIDLGDSSLNDVDLNPISFSSTNASFEVTAIPEPSSLIFGAILGVGGVMYRKRFGKRKRLPVILASGPKDR